MLGYITWTADPVIFHLGPLSVRWYGLMWGIGFLVGYEMISRIFKHENYPKDWADKIFIYMAVGTLVGARIGHCFFYAPQHYLSHPLEIFKIWEGGLSSHGGAVGILLAMFFFDKYVSKKGFIWILDRIAIPVAFTGMCIRFGNLMNSEIYGEHTTMPWGFIFVRDGQDQASHPTQIYEMLYCLVSLVITSYLYIKKKGYEIKGLLIGVLLVVVFGSRILVEFLKNVQEDFEKEMLLNMGQLLSIPLFIWGVYLLFNASKEWRKRKG